MDWDSYFFNICSMVAQRSKCMSRQIGAVLVRDNTIIGTGYNSPPRKVPTCGERYYLDTNLREALKQRDIDPDDVKYHSICPRYVLGFKSGEGLEWCVAGHAEKNCLINSARIGICTKGSIMYMTCGIPCTPCLVSIINAGVTEIVVTEKSYYDVSASYLIQNSDLEVRIFKHLCKHEHTPLCTICKDCGEYVISKGEENESKNL